MNAVRWLALVLPVVLTGCAIHQKITPVATLSTPEVCIIHSPGVRAGFLESYQRALVNQGYAVKQLPASASIADCPVTSTYSGKWRWDLALYMAYAEIKVFHQGKLAGEATYDAQSGGSNMRKFIDAQEKITELVKQLFPARTGV